jgi:hypothetical protein
MHTCMFMLHLQIIDQLARSRPLHTCIHVNASHALKPQENYGSFDMNTCMFEYACTHDKIHYRLLLSVYQTGSWPSLAHHISACARNAQELVSPLAPCIPPTSPSLSLSTVAHCTKEPRPGLMIFAPVEVEAIGAGVLVCENG